MSESRKIRDKVLPLIRDLADPVLDIGCGDDKICENAIGVDLRNLPNVDFKQDIRNFDKFTGACGAVFSSHVLEHVDDEYGSIKQWISFLKPGGLLLLYLPDDRHYSENLTNVEHLRIYNYEVFMRWFGKCAPEMSVFSSGMDVGIDRYSFYVFSRLTISSR